MDEDILENFVWHSSVGVDDFIGDKERFVKEIPNSKKTRKAFINTGSEGNFLIHKTTRSLWKLSDDNKKIEAVFPTDVLTEEEVKQIMDEGA